MPAVTTVYRNVRGLRTAIKDMSRMRHIASVLTKHGFGWVITKLNLADTVGIKNIMDYRDSEENLYSTAKRIRMAIEDLGPTFIKLGQILSTRADLLPEDIIEQLQYLQDDVPPLELTEIESQIESQLDKSISELFEHFNPEPLACASIAQVHRAILHDGSKVVVKVQRPNLRPQIESDLNILHFLAAQAAELIPELQLVDPVGVVSEFDKALRKEMDFTIERTNIERFQNSFRDFEGVHIPIIYPEYCTPAVLTMEFVDGVKITQAVEKLGADPYALAPTMLKALFKMILKDGFFHGDLHPGNILIRDDLTITLIDFGLVGRMLPGQRDRIIELIGALHREDYEMVARVVFELGTKVPGVSYDFDAFQSDVTEIMETHFTGKTLAGIEFQSFFQDLAAGAIRHQLRLPPTYTMVFKAMMTVEGIGKTLIPDVDLVEEARPFVAEMMAEKYNPKRLLQQSIQLASTASRVFNELSQTAPQLLKDIERGRLAFKVDLTHAEEMLRQQRRSTRLQAQALVVASTLISGTIALNFPGQTVFGINALSFGAFCVTGFFGIPLLLSLMRSD